MDGPFGAQAEARCREGAALMNRILGLALCVCAALIISGCDELEDAIDGIEGSGNVVTETRAVSGFDEIVVLGSGDVVVSVTGTESLLVEAEDNIMPLLTTEVKGGRLELGSKSSFSTNRGINYTITVVSLDGVEINGSGDVTATGIDADSFAVEINGSGNVEVTGTSAQLDVAVSGSGDYDGADLVAATGKVTISGSGQAVVNVTDDLEARVSGSGSIEYIGDPVLDADTSGSGSISRR